MENESSIKEMIRDSLEQIRTVIDADTIVGKQIITPGGTVIIPISKVSMGFATGGLDLHAKNGESANFGGGGGTGVSVSPVGFLTVSPEGEVKMVPMTPGLDSPIEQLAKIVSQIPDIVSRVKNIVGKGDDAEVVPSDEERAYEEKLAEDLANEVAVAAEEEDSSENDESLSWKERRRLKKEQKKLAKSVVRNEATGKVTDDSIGSGTL